MNSILRKQHRTKKPRAQRFILLAALVGVASLFSSLFNNNTVQANYTGASYETLFASSSTTTDSTWQSILGYGSGTGSCSARSGTTTVPWLLESNNFYSVGSCASRANDGGGGYFKSAPGGYSSSSSHGSSGELGVCTNYSASEIWANEGDDTDYEMSFFGNEAPHLIDGVYSHGSSWFRHTFYLADNEYLAEKIEVFSIADDWHEVYINGSYIGGSGSTIGKVDTVVDKSILYSGDNNTITIQAVDKARKVDRDRGKGMCFQVYGTNVPPPRLAFRHNVSIETGLSYGEKLAAGQEISPSHSVKNTGNGSGATYDTDLRVRVRADDRSILLSYDDDTSILNSEESQSSLDSSKSKSFTDALSFTVPGSIGGIRVAEVCFRARVTPVSGYSDGAREITNSGYASDSSCYDVPPPPPVVTCGEIRITDRLIEFNFSVSNVIDTRSRAKISYRVLDDSASEVGNGKALAESSGGLPSGRKRQLKLTDNTGEEAYKMYGIVPTADVSYTIEADLLVRHTYNKVVDVNVICGGSAEVLPDQPYVRLYGNDVFAGGSFDCSVIAGPKWVRAYGMLDTPEDHTTYKGSASELAVFAADEIVGLLPGAQTNAARSALSELSFANSDASFPTNAGTLQFGGGFAGDSLCADEFPPTDGFATFPDTPTTLSGRQGGYERTGDATITASSINNADRATLVTAGDVIIRGNIAYANDSWATDEDIPLVQIYAGGNIYIEGSVTQLDGLYVAKGTITTCANLRGVVPAVYDPAANSADVAADCSANLTVNGTFIGQRIHLHRIPGNIGDGNPGEGPNSNIAEVFRFSPEMYLALLSVSRGTPAGSFDSILTLPPAF